MKPGKINTLFRKQAQQLQLTLAAVIELRTIGSVHHFRVTYKKTRTLYRIVSVINGKHTYKMHDQLKKLYHQLGIIRDTQLQLQRLRKDAGLVKSRQDILLTGLKNRLKQAWMDFSKMIASIDTKKEMRLMPDAVPHLSRGVKINEWSKAEWKEVQKQVQVVKISNEGMHLIRKALKDLYYAAQFSKKWEAQVLTSSCWKLKDTGAIKLLLSHLGTYQDYVTLLRFAATNTSAKQSLTEKKRLQKIAADWRLKKNSLHQQLSQKLKSNLR